MSFAMPSSTNVFLPEVTGNLFINYSRNVKDFKINSYVTLTKVEKTVGVYPRIDPLTQVNVQGIDGDAYAWPDGANSPEGPVSVPQHEFVPYQTKRRRVVSRLGDLAIEQASFPLKDLAAQQLGPKLMTLRTKLVYDVLTNTSNHLSGHFATATALGGGFFSAGSITNAYVQKAIMAAARKIQTDTASQVKYTDLTILIGPELADAMARSPEIRDFIAQSPSAMDQVRGNKPGQNAMYGLPDQLYGFKLMVEDSSFNSNNRAGTSNQGFIWDANTMAIVARPGQLKASNASAFSSVHLFMKEEMNAEQFNEVKHRVTEFYATDDYDVQLAAPRTAFLITNCLS